MFWEKTEIPSVKFFTLPIKTVYGKITNKNTVKVHR